ncbi:TPA: protein kinase domain-containing protein [Legionella anisa]|uniref:protein kinase domain-containing protein n=1 Tax=Legionella anisa TaxID=28082 RepID=UPI0019814B67|nr:protein kinase [Legionella anisa]MBN5936463.1 protein kinase [Legionella anisa]
MKKNSKNDSSKKDTDKKQENGLSISRALQATKRKIFPHKAPATQEKNPSTDGKKQTDSTKEQLHQSITGNALYQSIKSPPAHIERQLMSDEEARKMLAQYEKGKRANMSREATMDLYRSLLSQKPSKKEFQAKQDETSIPVSQERTITKGERLEANQSSEKSSYMANGIIYHRDHKGSKTQFISTMDTGGDDIAVRDVSHSANDPLKKVNVTEPSDRKKTGKLYESRMVNGRIYRYDQPSPEAELSSQRPTLQELIARDVPGSWKQKVNQTIDIDLPDSQDKISVKLIASKKLGGGGFGTAKKILVEHLDGRQEKMVVKVIKHEHHSDFKLIEREGEFLKDVGMLMGTHVDTSQHQFFMPYVGKKVSRYLINQDPGNMQFNLSVEERCVTIRGLLESLAKIHERKIIHSDVGIHNLGLRKHPLSAALFDFNLSIREGEKRGNAGIPLTAAPEILKGIPNSYETDVYSAGITIALILEITTYKLLTLPNDPPAPVAFLAPKKDIIFGEGDREEGAITKMQRKYGFTAEQAEGIYSMLEKMTSKDPALRPTAAESCAAFNELLTSPKVSMEYQHS